MIQKCRFAILALFLFAVCAAAQWKVAPGSKVFIAKMDNDLDGFIAAEVLKQKLPLLVVTDETAADYVLTGGSVKADDKWYNLSSAAKTRMRGTSKC